MNLSREYAEEWIGYWSYVMQRASEASFQAVRGLQERTYEPKDLMSDVFAFWSDMSTAYVTAARGPDRRPAMVMFRVDIGDDFHPAKTIPVFAPSLPSREPSVVLETIEPRPEHGRLIRSDNIHARIRNGRELEIKLIGLNQLDGRSIQRPDMLLAPAKYRAVIHVDEVALAELFIVVEQTPRRPWKRP